MVPTKPLAETDMFAWALRLPAAEAVFAATLLRPVPGVEVLEQVGEIWIRGASADAALQQKLRSIPALDCYMRTREGNLTRWDESVPCGTLPPGDWQPVAQWLEVTLPIATLAGGLPHGVPLRLVRTEAIVDSNLLLTTWAPWFRYATTAPLARLASLSFAVADASRVLVRGTPPPPIPGRHFVLQQDIAVPAGFQFEFSLDAATVRQTLKLAADQIGLFDADASVDILNEACFVHATRSAIRQTDRVLSQSSGETEP